MHRSSPQENYLKGLFSASQPPFSRPRRRKTLKITKRFSSDGSADSGPPGRPAWRCDRAAEPRSDARVDTGIHPSVTHLLARDLCAASPCRPTHVSVFKPASLHDRLQTDLTLLARPRHAQWDPLGLLAVRALLRERLGALGDLEEHAFQQGTTKGINLILKLPGQRPRLPPLLVGAHYDGAPQTPGADDNASGVAALLELASRWRAEPPRRPVWLVAFDQEEEGLVGSRALALRLRADGQPLHLMVSLEMLAYTSSTQRYPHPAMNWLYGSRGDFIALVANLSAIPLLPGLARRVGRHVKTKVLPVPMRGRTLPDTRRSDHSPFWDQGFNALMVTDTSFLRNPNYHSPSDEISSLDLPFLTAVCEGLHAALDCL